MNDVERHSKRKAFWTTKFFEEETVEDKDIETKEAPISVINPFRSDELAIDI